MRRTRTFSIFINGSMTDTHTVETNIKYSIEKNGYPGKTVKLPFKPVYQSCKDHGTALKTVLANLQDEQITGHIEGDYIVFPSPHRKEGVAEPEVEPAGNSYTPPGGGAESWLDMLKRMPGLNNLSNLEGEMQKAMSQLTPEQLREVQERVKNMTPEEKQAIMKSLGDLFKPKPGPR
ncbi:hypothetical protein ACTRW9_09945 [Nitrospina sp. 32_T5]|uniref:hypothetical protein n=1 Tax=unclassified Nitrospina TaxID=2638683 RepID=UPI003F9C59DE